jgi:hypothetical protein
MKPDMPVKESKKKRNSNTIPMIQATYGPIFVLSLNSQLHFNCNPTALKAA